MGEKISDGKDFMSKFISDHRIPEDARKYFAGIEWTQQHLSNPLYSAIPVFSRTLKSTGEDFFFARTLNTPSTIEHLLSLQLKKLTRPQETPKGTQFTRLSHNEATPVPKTPDAIFLLKLGRPGIDGHPSVIHGGVACAILDEMMGLCVMLHDRDHDGPRDALFTASLNVTYRAPIATPSDILVRCWLVAIQGRKWLTRGQIVSKDGLVMTEGEGIWVQTKREGKL